MTRMDTPLVGMGSITQIQLKNTNPMSYNPDLTTMGMRWTSRDALTVFLIALLLRIVSVAVTTLTSLNTYSQADANGFAQHANRIANTILSGSFPVLNFNDIYDVWGAMLSPFWLLPGPSRIYARLGMALLGAVAVYNVYVIVRYHHSRYAGAIAVLPMLFYPSTLFLHAAVLREAMILFGLTSAARLLLVPGPRLTTGQQVGLATMFLGIATILREDNLPVYVLVLAVAVFLKLEPWRRHEYLTKSAAGISIVVAPAIVVDYGNDVLDRLVYLRRVRARGRTEYLGSVLPDTIPQAFAFSWIGAMYFLFTPFPWMVSHVMDFVVMFEGLTNLVYALGVVSGAQVLARKTFPGTIALVVGVVVGSVLYGLGTVNVGTAVRHRQMILWAIFVLGGIGLAEHIRIRLPERDI
ncbi:hypothetical protein HLASF_0934 [Halanaeroarchaeum sulfurireducens]|uniref:Glycosyltransferase RgtA/B/C/D-like domain-containing protein n=2 Tax=Halanaeroarchaeum sulfurireducens TaxID=1604004 RepID=A0A0F7PCQ3_9EURY|nr:hypothetical protein HLASF_0934 [Halanaeroarchaeum sulfurireducens]